MAVFNVAEVLRSCVPTEQADPETGCRACGENARTDYELCRQSYYLKKQNEIVGTTEKISELEELIENQNQQITSLIEGSQQDAKITGQLESSLQISYLLNGALGIVVAGLAVFIIIKKLREK